MLGNDTISTWTPAQLAKFIRQVAAANYDLPSGLSLTNLEVENLKVSGSFDFQVAIGTHIGEFGAGTRGKIGLLRAGDDYANLLWDSYTGKWVTSPIQVTQKVGTTFESHTSTSFQNLSQHGSGLFLMRPFSNAGLSTQIRMFVQLTSSAGHSVEARMEASSFNFGGSSIGSSTHGLVSTTGTGIMLDTGWVTFSGTTGDVVRITPSFRTTNASSQVSSGVSSIYVRYVSS